jgi:hypothetical protein
MFGSSWLRERSTRRARDGRSSAIALVTKLFQTAGTTVVVIGGIIGLVYVSFQASPAGPDHPPRSGIVVRTEVTALWIPRALLHMVQGETGTPVFRSPEALQTELRRRGLNDAWYAVTYRGYQVDGAAVEITQVRRISEAHAHIEEFRDMMAIAAGHPPHHEVQEFSHVKLEIIPDTMLNADPRKAVSQLIAERTLFPNKRPGREVGDGREN